MRAVASSPDRREISSDSPFLPTNHGTPMKDEASYTCDSCGEEIVVPIDLSAGTRQKYVEDCPICCRPNVIHVEVSDEGEVLVWAEGE